MTDQNPDRTHAGLHPGSGPQADIEERLAWLADNPPRVGLYADNQGMTILPVGVLREAASTIHDLRANYNELAASFSTASDEIAHLTEQVRAAEAVITAAQEMLDAVHWRHANGGVWTSIANKAAPLHEALRRHAALAALPVSQEAKG